MMPVLRQIANLMAPIWPIVTGGCENQRDMGDAGAGVVRDGVAAAGDAGGEGESNAGFAGGVRTSRRAGGL
ncbi:MAG TPA: hypothetical protein VFC39_02145 [Acidobacteriaceae bacterium]|nr:hypothetical protein [Acidobacteriaceae bacterium]